MPTSKPTPRHATAAWLAVGAMLPIIAVAVWQFVRPADHSPSPDRGSAAPNTADAATPPERGPGFRELALESGLDVRMRFLLEELGAKFKVNLYDHGCGVAVGDYDGDGDDDVLFVNQLGANALYANRGDGTFEHDAAASADVALADRVCVGATFSDYDNDGHQDLFVTSTRGGNALLRNNGRGRFEEVTAAAGVELVKHSQTAAFFDYDNDGHLDLFVTNSAEWTTEEFNQASGYFAGKSNLFEVIDSPKEYNVLYRNNGDGTFTDVTDEAGLRGRGWGGDVAVFDFDDDGRLDLFVTSMFGSSQLFRNLGQGRFQDVTRDALDRTSFGAIGSKAFDYNNDGRLDLFVADMHSDMWTGWDATDQVLEPDKKYPYACGPHGNTREVLARERKMFDRLDLAYDEVLFGNTLYQNEGGARFTEVSDVAQMETFWPWGVATGDFDNDGFEDAFIPSGMGFPFFYWPNCLMMNQGNGTFVDRASVHGIDPPPRGVYFEDSIDGRPAPRSSRCAATADFDGDGRLDLVVNNFNDVPYYYRNEFPRQNYVAFRLTGTGSNRDAIGAVVKLHLGREVLLRQVHCAGGYLSQSSKTLHFGLGARTRIDRAEIRWPSGLRQALEEPAVNQLHRITEPTGSSDSASRADG